MRWPHWQQQMEYNRTRTLGLLDTIEKLPSPAAVLGFRPGPGRAHIAWQLMHIGITEELFATSRLTTDRTTIFADITPRFQGGSTPDDDIPPATLIREVLGRSRERLFETISRFDDADLSQEKWLARDGRQRTLQEILNILLWHEPHHQGQAHITNNIYKATQT